MGITLRQLEAFVAVAREGNVTRAADTLRLSQSAVSMSLAELERQLGERLFDRRGKRLVMNDQGRVLIPKAADVLFRVREIDALFSGPEQQLAGLLRVGASSTIGNYLMPRILGAFTSTHPRARLSLDVGNTEQIVQELLRFTIDIGFIEGFCHRPDIETIPWRQDRLAIHAGAEHPLARKRNIDIHDLMQARWILREQGSGTREVFENALAGKMDGIRVYLELGNTEAIKEAVEAGLGISCLSLLATRRARQSGALVALKTPFLDLRRNFYLLLHGEKYRSRLLRRFITFCQDYPANGDDSADSATG
ncbi:DNA-binding transcriptional LysR family regulator [Geothermobacter ehrlichii]|uniref:DNA-binding transcriptional LysR family regulator n=1 Tax=Geothermobacter ehrlichii TaxID=213224 RepID=A0A5D3WND6_9BACT|nr:LysR family transcriptional regulator [Geothermobacter ehrlichii]TYO99169.1 DNA-binding transcriptional LysR family regulator [Geothermobacter ehrlichii]